MSLIFNKLYIKVLNENTTTFNKEEAISKLSNFLGSPLKPYAKDFVEAGLKYGIDPYLTASIASLETGHGSAPVFTKYKNISGKWDAKAGRHATYSNVVDSIYDQAKFLKNNYFDKGLTTIETIGAKYAPVGAKNDPNRTNASWPVNVSKLYSKATGGQNIGTLPVNNIVDTKNDTNSTGSVVSSDYDSPMAAFIGLGQGLETLSKAIKGGM